MHSVTLGRLALLFFSAPAWQNVQRTFFSTCTRWGKAIGCSGAEGARLQAALATRHRNAGSRAQAPGNRVGGVGTEGIIPKARAGNQESGVRIWHPKSQIENIQNSELKF